MKNTSRTRVRRERRAIGAAVRRGKDEGLLELMGLESAREAEIASEPLPRGARAAGALTMRQTLRLAGV